MHRKLGGEKKVSERQFQETARKIEASQRAVETPAARIKRLEEAGRLDPACPSCQPAYDAFRAGASEPPFGPPHRPSDRCESGKRPHCTCDTCF